MNLPATIYVIDDDDIVRDSLKFQLESAGYIVKTFASGPDFLDALPQQAVGCLVLDIIMPEITGPELQTEMTNRGIKLPIIFLSGYGDIPLAVKTVQAGAVDFLTKPVDAQHLLNSIETALALNVKNKQNDNANSALNKRLKIITKREREVMTLALSGFSNKEISKRLNISSRTVEHHRSSILSKSGVDNFLQLLNLIDAD